VPMLALANGTVPEPITGLTLVAHDPSMTQRYEMDGWPAGRVPKQAIVDTLFDYSNISEGN
jgi:hypothetical protein